MVLASTVSLSVNLSAIFVGLRNCLLNVDALPKMKEGPSRKN